MTVALQWLPALGLVLPLVTAVAAHEASAAPGPRPDQGPGPIPKDATSPKWPTPLWEVSPLAGMMRQDMAELGRDGLERAVATLGQRLILTAESQAIDTLGDLELLARLGVAAQMLREVSEPSENLLQVERATAFAFFAVGRRYETRDDLRFAVDALDGDTGGAGKQLRDLVRGMRRYGAEWFIAAAKRLEAAGGLDAETSHQWGRLDLDEGRAESAAQRLSALFSQAPDRELLRSMCEAFLAVEEGASPESTRLLRRLGELKVSLAKSPGLAAELEVCLERRTDTRLTADFERRAKTGQVTSTEVAAQVVRYQRLEREGAAELLARQAAASDPEAGGVILAELLFKRSRWESLRSLLSEARARGPLSQRLRQLEALALAAMTARAALGEAITVEGDPDRALAEAGLPPLVERGQRVMLAMARWIGAGERRAEAKAALDREMAETLKRHGDSAQGLAVVLIAALGSDRLDEGLGKIRQKLPALRKAATRNKTRGVPGADAVAEVARFEALLAQVDLGMGVRRRDAARINKALKGLARVERATLTESERHELLLTEVVGRLTALELGRGIARADVDRARKELLDGEWALSRSEPRERQALQARALTLGTLALLADQPDAAVTRLQEARSVATGALGMLAGGLSLILAGDAPAAATLCERAGDEERPGLMQLLLACRAAGVEGERRRELWREVLALWGPASSPSGDKRHETHALFYGSFDIGVTVMPGEPFALILAAQPQLVLLPQLLPPGTYVEEWAR